MIDKPEPKSTVQRARELSERPGARTAASVSQRDLIAMVDAATQAQRTIREIANAPGWARIAEQIAAVNLSMKDPAFIETLNAFQRDAEALSLSAHAAFLPASQVLAKFAQEVTLSLAPFQPLLVSLPEWRASIIDRMGALQRPWVLEAEIGVSVAGFGRLARLSDATHIDLPFSEPVAELLADELGVPSEIDDDRDPTARDSAAVALGMRPELIAFPPAVYGEIVLAAGFRFAISRASIPRAIEAADSDAAFDPMHTAVIQDLEQRLRQLVEDRLRAIDGAAWVKRRVSEAVRKRWMERQAEDRDDNRTVYGLIQYSDFMDLADVITQRRNWSEVFGSIFQNEDDFRASLRRLHPVRRALAHARPLGRSDVLTLVAESTRILRALGIDALGVTTSA